MSTHQHSTNGSPESGNERRDGHHDEIAHVTPMKLLFGVWGALMILTVVTVAVTLIDFGAHTNLIIAMAIATIKAGLVVTYFMHLRWDRPFHTLIFLGSLLFVSLFISMTLLDRSEYQGSIEEMYLKKGQ
ncbi:MAG TPA: cytochrome C oxidase subunit IV family protein [Polyangiaceae bacterium]|jgi:cytochrome c oxidase subunit 4|nr:cytochrome C oxidase subunit IV family protein [Polyangiaceae bacterium]